MHQCGFDQYGVLYGTVVQQDKEMELYMRGTYMETRDMYLNVFSSGTFDFFRRLTRTYSAEEQSQKSCILWYV